MDLLEGIAARVRSSVHLDDDDREDNEDDPLEPRPRSPKYIVRFELTAREVSVTSHSPVAIGEGDHVFVAGWYRAGVLDALAYRNESTLAEGNRGWWPMLALSIMLLVVSLAMLGMTSDSSPSEPIPPILAGLLGAAGVYLGHGALRILVARNLLRRQAQRS